MKVEMELSFAVIIHFLCSSVAGTELVLLGDGGGLFAVRMQTWLLNVNEKKSSR